MERKIRGKAFWATVLATVMTAGAVAGGVAVAGSLSSAPTAASSSHAAADAASSSNALPAAAASELAAPASATPSSNGPHPGTIEAYEPVPGGATTEDPAVAYDTTSYEVILNVYETLVNYNGSSTSTFVPTLATCVPGQGGQCAKDYGAGFTGIFNSTGANYTGTNGEPEYWTFVIDPAAHFYDPSTGASFSVYPTDVMFSIARTLAWSTYPVVSKTSGWILAQSLLPNGNPKWDNGLHAPFNNTPSNVLDSMLINDSAYCPTAAMDGVHGNGCITFVANGSGAYWPDFLDFVADNLGGSIVPCGYFTFESAGVPGWTGTKAANGDGSCLLPNGGTTTDSSAWSTYVAGLSPTAWDSFIKLDANWPTPQPKVQWSMVGSGPYYASISPGVSYALAASPGYAQPSGCGGNPTDFPGQYTGYCNPAPKGYIPKVDVTWETASEGDSLGTSAIEAGTADFAGIYTTQTTTLLGYVHSGLWQYDLFPTLSTAFTTINLDVDYSAYNTSFAGTPLEANPIPPAFFSDVGLRNFYIQAYPYTTVEDTINTVDGVQFAFNAGGPIPNGMGNYYPSNVTWPYTFGNPTQSASVAGSAAWWWSQLTTSSSPYYNATIAKDCTSSNPCTWPIGYFDGAPADLTLIDDWAGEIYALSGHTLEPWPLAMTFSTFLGTLVGPSESPLISTVGFGWAPDYPDPSDYMVPIGGPDGDYTGPDTFSEQLALPQYNDTTTCGHSGLQTEATAYANLTYWANAATKPASGLINSKCQGVAYAVASYWIAVADALAPSDQRVLDFNLIEQVLNALGMYVWNGQSNELIGFAPWIAPGSINENPMIGGGGDLVWFHVQYRSVYTITVTESGLPAGTSWSATAANDTITSTASSIAFPPQSNNSVGYPYAVSFVPGYSVTPANGTVVIAGANVTISVTYAALAHPTEVSTVTINETGLVSNTSWAVVVAGFGAVSSNTSSLQFQLPNGTPTTTYDFQAQPVLGYATPAAGTVIVEAAPVSTSVAYVGAFAPTYLLEFQEAGLPAGTSWSVTLASTTTAYPQTVNPYTQTSTLTDNVFVEANGSFNYTVSTGAGYAPLLAFGTATVSGSSITVVIVFGPTYDVTFTQTGLPSGTTWTVNFDGQAQSAVAPASIVFAVTNNSWTYSAAASGYTASPSGGSVLVTGASQSVPVAFSKPAGPASTYLSPLAEGLVGGLAALAVIGFVLWGTSRRGKGGPAPPTTWTGEQTPPAGGTSPPPPPKT